MLKRKMLQKLRAWRSTRKAECLLVKGARQVGKSFIINAFGESDYESFIPIDFVKNEEIKGIFEGPLDADAIYARISLFVPGVRFVEGRTLIFLDEVQECPRARTALKYLAQDGRYDVIASGSLLGIQYGSGASDPGFVPVGYERAVEMHPLDFEEYLWARGYDEAATALLRGYLERLEPVPRGVNERMMSLVREYLAIGGMPAVVDSFVRSNNYGVAHESQQLLLASYLDDIARYASPTERVKARACFESLPRQLAKENTKFQYSVVERRGSARKFEGSVDWLEGARMVCRCQAVSTPSFPLVSYEDEGRFRLYAADTGLLMAMHPFEMKAAVVTNTLAGPMKGGLYENLVAGMLAKESVGLRYWTSRNGSREIEFLVDGEGASVAPIEVKAGRGSTVSLNEMLEREDVRLGYKLVDGNIGKEGKKVTLPVYMGCFLAQSLAGPERGAAVAEAGRP